MHQIPSVVLMSVLLACRGGDSGDSAAPTDSGGQDTAPSQTFPDLPTGACGLAEHAWQPLEDMGQLVELDEADELSFSAEALDGLLPTVGLDALVPVDNGVRTFRVRYTTQDKGATVEATGLLLFPELVERQDVPLLLWTHPTTGFMDDCAPTAMGVVGAAYPVLLASRGYAVVAPDYLGMAGWGEPSGQLHPWVVAEPTAVASLDGLRAMLRFVEEKGEARGITGRPDAARTVIIGASEGGFAALWADRYQAEYLPEVELVGVVASIPPTDLRALAERAVTHLGETTAGLAGGIVTMHDWFEVEAPLSEVIVPPLDTQIRETLLSTCTDYGAALEGVETIDDLFTADFQAAATAGTDLEPWTCILDDASIAKATLPRGSDAPVLVVTAENDDLAWAPPVHADIPRLCAQGYAIEHRQCADASHVEGAVQSLPYQLDWLDRATAGEELATTCQVADPVDCTVTP